MTHAPGDIYWFTPDSAAGEGPRIPHPHVIAGIDGDRATLCALTSNLGRVSMPGNILLDAGEANLTRQSVVEVSKRTTVETVRLGAYSGTLRAERVAQIAAGIRFIETSFLH
ncbi:MAG: type II toxin-antitoxin system PemK/MazF family toxin [Chloroflexi bacterium]|nr:type II toxin-antitoxin system PemK/MazF family toxin [Chloroflexota bacterium]